MSLIVYRSEPIRAILFQNVAVFSRQMELHIVSPPSFPWFVVVFQFFVILAMYAVYKIDDEARAIYFDRCDSSSASHKVPFHRGGLKH